MGHVHYDLKFVGLVLKQQVLMNRAHPQGKYHTGSSFHATELPALKLNFLHNQLAWEGNHTFPS